MGISLKPKCTKQVCVAMKHHTRGFNEVKQAQEGKHLSDVPLFQLPDEEGVGVRL